jgi:hypothetical protein
MLRQPPRSQEFPLARQQAERVTHGGAAGEPPGISSREPVQLLPYIARLLDHRGPSRSCLGGQFAGQRRDLFAGRSRTRKVKAEVARHWWLLHGDSWAGGGFICALVLRSLSLLGGPFAPLKALVGTLARAGFTGPGHCPGIYRRDRPSSAATMEATHNLAPTQPCADRLPAEPDQARSEPHGSEIPATDEA